MNTQGWFPLGWTGWLSLQSKGLSRVFFNTMIHKHKFFGAQLSLYSNFHIYTWLLKKPAWFSWIFLSKVISFLFNMLSTFAIAFLPRSKHLLISWLQSPSAVILVPQKIKSLSISVISPTICHEVIGPDAMIFILWILNFKPPLKHSSFIFIKRLFSSSSFSAIRMASYA